MSITSRSSSAFLSSKTGKEKLIIRKNKAKTKPAITSESRGSITRGNPALIKAADARTPIDMNISPRVCSESEIKTSLFSFFPNRYSKAATIIFKRRVAKTPAKAAISSSGARDDSKPRIAFPAIIAAIMNSIAPIKNDAIVSCL